MKKGAWPQIWHKIDGADTAMKMVLEEIQPKVRSKENMRLFFTLEGQPTWHTKHLESNCVTVLFPSWNFPTKLYFLFIVVAELDYEI